MALPLWNSKTAHAIQLCLHPNDGVPLGICGSGHPSNINSPHKPGLSLGQSRRRRAAQKVYVKRVYLPFSLANVRELHPLFFSLCPTIHRQMCKFTLRTSKTLQTLRKTGKHGGRTSLFNEVSVFMVHGWLFLTVPLPSLTILVFFVLLPERKGKQDEN